MNYYDELGVQPDASPEEIRRAYLRLVRLLHPDQIQDQDTRQVADRQLQRLNGIIAVLSDPVRRRQYDRSLLEPPSKALARRIYLPPQVLKRTAVCMCAIGLAVMAATYYLAGSRPAAPPVPSPTHLTLPAVADGPSVPSLSPPGEAQTAHSEPREPRTEQRTASLAPRRPSPARLGQAGAVELEKPSVILREAAPELTSVPQSQSQQAAAAAPGAQREPAPRGGPDRTAPESHTSLAGLWLYVPPRLSTDSPFFYAPEYIELRIGQEGGRLAGRYRARYRVADRAIFPEVRFEFEGDAGRETYDWRGPGGARGEVRLRLERANYLEVTWWATELGTTLGLASGTAVLRRQ